VFSLGAAPAVPAQHLIDIPTTIRDGSARILASQFDIGSIKAVFDCNPDTLARSANINPLVITIEFNERIPVTSMRLRMGDQGTWSMEGSI